MAEKPPEWFARFIITTSIHPYLKDALKLRDRMGNTRKDLEEALWSIEGVEKAPPGLSTKKSHAAHQSDAGMATDGASKGNHKARHMKDLICGVNPKVDKTRTAAELIALTKSLPRCLEDCAPFQVLDVNGECLLAYFPDAISKVWHQPNPEFSDSSLTGMTLVLQKAVDKLLAGMHVDTPEEKAEKAKARAEKAAQKAAAAAKKAAEKVIRQGGKGEVPKGKRVEQPAAKNTTEEKGKLENSRYYIKDPEQQKMDQQGTYYFAVWTPQGHPYAVPTLNSVFLKTAGTSNICASFLFGHYNGSLVICTDMRGAGYTLNACGTFLKHLHSADSDH